MAPARAARSSKPGRRARAVPLAERIGQRVRELRVSRGLSLADLGAATDLSPSFLSLLETGKSDISVGRLTRIAEYLGVTVPQLTQESWDHKPTVVRRRNRPRTRWRELDLTVLGLAPALNSRNVFNILELEPGAAVVADRPPPATPLAEFFFFVLEGEIAVTLEGERSVRLRQGDSMSFPSERWRATRNKIDGVSSVLTCSTHVDTSVFASD